MWILEILGIVMAGGRGERVYPLTKDRVKAAVPFQFRVQRPSLATVLAVKRDNGVAMSRTFFSRRSRSPG